MKLMRSLVLPRTDPYPLQRPIGKNNRIPWLQCAQIEVLWEKPLAGISFEEVASRRRSQRSLKLASLDTVLSIVRETFRIEEEAAGGQEIRYRKKVISAGALHPIQALVLRSNVAPLVYDDQFDRVFELAVEDKLSLSQAMVELMNILPSATGHWILLVGDQKRTSRFYANSHSLFWRDAGAAMQLLSLNAEAFGLGTCAVGALGQAIVKAIVGDDTDIVATGITAIGII